MTPCKYCNQPLHIEYQECAPYGRNEAGELVGLGRMIQVDCRNDNVNGTGGECDAFMVTGNGPNFQVTIDRYVAYNRMISAPVILIDAPARSDETIRFFE